MKWGGYNRNGEKRISQFFRWIRFSLRRRTWWNISLVADLRICHSCFI